MKKKVVAIITSIVLTSSFLVGCGNDKKESSNEKTSVTSVNKKTIADAMMEFTNSSLSLADELQNVVKNSLEGKLEDVKTSCDIVMEKLNSSIETMGEFSYLQGKEKDFINKSIEYFEAFKSYIKFMSNMTSGNFSIESLQDFSTTMENLINKQEECMQVMTDLGYEYTEKLKDLEIK